MKNDKHHFSPDMRNEMWCGLCGEHVADTQHVRALPSQPTGLTAYKLWRQVFRGRRSHVELR